MKHRHHVEKLAKRLTAVLGRHPDELGLVLDPDGFVLMKDLVRALNEEDGWRHIRQHDLVEAAYTLSPCPVEIDGERIRAVSRQELPFPALPKTRDVLPGLAYCAIRRRQYPVVLENGLLPGTNAMGIVLSRDPEMALRIGRRRDAEPVMLTVNLDRLARHGICLRCYGHHLMIVDKLPVGTFGGPLLRASDTAAEKSVRPVKPVVPPLHAGSYFPDLSQLAAPVKNHRQRPEKEKNQWKRDRKQKERTRSGK
ncbi:hypothetical protein LJC47_03595 [Desulfosarcina sp. OttesenSCG-928-B08]|nr:hypothetical protein [Desulfosarcina sp. OttesenSCG-928-B08]